jgi:hypothetical protein
LRSGKTDIQALLGLLIYDRPGPVAFAGLWERLVRQIPQERRPHHWLRWHMVRQGLRETGRLATALVYASKKLSHTPARGGPKTMEGSFYFVERKLPPSERWKRRS